MHVAVYIFGRSNLRIIDTQSVPLLKTLLSSLPRAVIIMRCCVILQLGWGAWWFKVATHTPIGWLFAGLVVLVLRRCLQLGVPTWHGLQHVVERPRQAKHSCQRAIPTRSSAYQRSRDQQVCTLIHPDAFAATRALFVLVHLFWRRCTIAAVLVVIMAWKLLRTRCTSKCKMHQKELGLCYLTSNDHSSHPYLLLQDVLNSILLTVAYLRNTSGYWPDQQNN